MYININRYLYFICYWWQLHGEQRQLGKQLQPCILAISAIPPVAIKSPTTKGNIACFIVCTSGILTIPFEHTFTLYLILDTPTRGVWIWNLMRILHILIIVSLKFVKFMKPKINLIMSG